MGAGGGLLLGRDSESAVLAGLLNDARHGRGAPLVLCGERGVGKTALLEHAATLATGFEILRTRAVEFESDTAYAGLLELLRPLLHLRECLPARQRGALESALVLGPPLPRDAVAVGSATLSLLTEAAKSLPLLAVVDDAQLLDSPSSAALGFAARRVGAERVVLLFAIRVPAPTALGFADLPQLTVEALAPTAAASVLTASAKSPISARVQDQLLKAAGGNPRALRELPGMLTASQLMGIEPLPRVLSTSARHRFALGERRDLLTGARALGRTAPEERSPFGAVPAERLTPQELRVAQIIADGATVREAAAKLFLSPKTIEAYLTRAYRKLGVRNRAQLATTLINFERDL